MSFPKDDTILPKRSDERNWVFQAFDSAESLRMIARAVFSLISRWRGTAVMAPVMTLQYQSWSCP